MRVAYLIGSLNRGGAETLLLDVFRSASSGGLDIFGVYRKSGVMKSDFEECGVPLINLCLTKNIIGYLIKLRYLIRSNQVKIVHAHQPLDAFLAFFACYGLKVPVLLTFHGYDYNEKNIGKLIIRFIIRKTKFNIYVSESQRDYYSSKYDLPADYQKVVNNGISFDKFNNVSKANADDNLRVKLHEVSLLLGSVGNFLPVRDHLTLCKFAKDLKDVFSDFHLVFIGQRSDVNPEYFDDCYTFCKENNLFDKVSFLGSRSDVVNLLPQLDAFVYATDHDTFGIAVVEAMASEVPVFVNDWKVMKEITLNGELATLYPTKQIDALLQDILTFQHDRSSFLSKAKIAKIKVLNIYSIENHIKLLKEIYNTAILNN